MLDDKSHLALLIFGARLQTDSQPPIHILNPPCPTTSSPGRILLSTSILHPIVPLCNRRWYDSRSRFVLIYTSITLGFSLWLFKGTIFFLYDISLSIDQKWPAAFTVLTCLSVVIISPGAHPLGTIFAEKESEDLHLLSVFNRAQK
jgi:hypothetical protein